MQMLCRPPVHGWSNRGRAGLAASCSASAPTAVPRPQAALKVLRCPLRQQQLLSLIPLQADLLALPLRLAAPPGNLVRQVPLLLPLFLLLQLALFLLGLPAQPPLLLPRRQQTLRPSSLLPLLLLANLLLLPPQALQVWLLPGPAALPPLLPRR